MTTPQTIRFSQLDSWYFRESRAHDSFGGSRLSSLFPPPVRTLAGALRSHIGQRMGVDWRDFAQAQPAQPLSRQLREQIGLGDDTGKLQIQGPWLSLHGQRLYPAPLFLLHHPQRKQLLRLRIGKAIHCDLGAHPRQPLRPLRMPELPPGNPGARAAENLWLDPAQYAACLVGQAPEQWHSLDQLRHQESRIGIALQTTTRSVEQGLLYNTAHHRLADGLAIELDVDGIDPWPTTSQALRLGGEGRCAFAEGIPRQTGPAAPRANGQTHGLILTLLTPADLGEGWQPPGFTPTEQQGNRCWQGTINDIPLTLHSAVIGKTLRQGGWDQASASPRPVRSLIPAGSAWYVTTAEGDLQPLIEQLHGSQIGNHQSLGYGQLAVALWQNHENQPNGENP
jgi:CRISPR-associated protein Cmr3